MANPSLFQQASTVLNSISQQATGRSGQTIATEADFISVAQTTLSLGKDAVYNALGNVIGRTVFSQRPYSASMLGLEKDLPTFGAYMRKINIVESDWQDNNAYKWPVTYDSTQTGHETGDGYSVDPWIIQKRDFIQTNFLGQSVFSDHYSIFEEQLETAFTGPSELMQFISLHATNENNKFEMFRQNTSRFLVSNFIAGLIAENNSSRVVKLLTLYNSELGLTGTDAFTASTILMPSNYPAFIKWAYAKIASIASMFRENSVKYQTTLNSKPVLHHTPYNKQKMYMLAGDRYAIDSRVLADTFHDNYLDNADVETVNFWQSIDEPDEINIKPTYTHTDGTVKVATNAVNKTGVFAFLFDEDALGWSMIHNNTHLTPMNPNGEFRNIWYNARIRTYSDNTEKGVVFLLE